MFNLGAYKGGIIVQQETVREHPIGKIAARTVGYERTSNGESYDGKGIEWAYRKYLNGKDGRILKQKIECQITKYQLCIGCLACESVCRFNAILVKSIDDSVVYKIDDEKCVRCKECVNHFDNGCYIKKVLVTRKDGRS